MRMDGFEERWKGIHIKALIPIRIQGLPDDAGRVGLLCIHRNDCKWVREAKDFALG